MDLEIAGTWRLRRLGDYGKLKAADAIRRLPGVTDEF